MTFNYKKKPFIAHKEPAVFDRPDDIVFSSDLNDTPVDILALGVDRGTQNILQLSKFKRLKWLDSSLLSDEFLTHAARLKTLNFFGISCTRQPIPDLPVKAPFWSFYSCTKLVDLNCIKFADPVRGISVSNCMAFTSTESLKRFTKLNELNILGSMGKSLKLDIEPVGELTNLEYACLKCKTTSKSLQPLCNLKKLKFLFIPNRFKKEEYESVLAACPKLDVIWLHNGKFYRDKGFIKDN